MTALPYLCIACHSQHLAAPFHTCTCAQELWRPVPRWPGRVWWQRWGRGRLCWGISTVPGCYTSLATTPSTTHTQRGQVPAGHTGLPTSAGQPEFWGDTRDGAWRSEQSGICYRGVQGGLLRLNRQAACCFPCRHCCRTGQTAGGRPCEGEWTNKGSKLAWRLRFCVARSHCPLPAGWETLHGGLALLIMSCH